MRKFCIHTFFHWCTFRLTTPMIDFNVGACVMVVCVCACVSMSICSCLFVCTLSLSSTFKNQTGQCWYLRIQTHGGLLALRNSKHWNRRTPLYSTYFEVQQQQINTVPKCAVLYCVIVGSKFFDSHYMVRVYLWFPSHSVAFFFHLYSVMWVQYSYVECRWIDR